MKINLIYSNTDKRSSSLLTPTLVECNTDLLCKSLLTPALATAECNSYLL
jgi:hypothetical protein